MSKKKAKSSQKKGNDKKTQAKKKVISKSSPKKSGKSVVKAKKVVAKSKSTPVKKNKVAAKPVRKAAPKKSIKKVAKKTVKVVAKAKPVKKVVAKKAKPLTKKKSIPAKKAPARKPVVKKTVTVKSKSAKPVSKAVKPVAKVAVKPKTVVVKPAKVVAVKPTAKVVEKVAKPVVTKAAAVEVKAVATKPIETNHTAKPAVVVPEKHVPEPKGKYELEYVIHSSTSILFEFLTSPSGLSEWFCDDVNIRHGIYTFFWDGSQQQAKLIRLVEEKFVRYQWLDKPDGSFFEFKVEKDDLTNDISLIITDFSDNDDEKASSKLLWDSQVDKLMHVLGSYF